MKLNTTLIILVIALAGSLGLLGKIAWDKHSIGQVNTQLNEQLMQSKLDIGRAETKFGNAEKYSGELEDALQAEIKERNAIVTRYGKLMGRYEAMKTWKGTGEILSGVKVVEIPGDCAKFSRGLLYEAVTEQTLVPMQALTGDYADHRIDIQCKFLPYPNRERDVPFKVTYRLHLAFEGQLVETITPSGAVNYYFNMFTMGPDGKPDGKLTLDEFTMVIDDQRAPKFFWWAPHLDVGLTLGLDSDMKFRTGGTLGISAMGYGLTENDLAWRFVRLSLDLSGEPGIGFDPVLYNLGELIPLVSNIWAGPHLMRTLKGDYILGFMVGAVL